jgi:hypothetical protein
MKRILFLFLFFGIFVQFTQAQIKVSSANNVGIGTETPLSKLSVGNSGNALSKVYIENSATTGLQRALQIYQLAPTYSYGNDFAYGGNSSIGLSAAGYKHVGFIASALGSVALTTGRSYGLYGQAGNALSGYNYAVYAQLAGSNNGAAVYGTIPGKVDNAIAGKYAGYFNGPVLITDSLKVNLNIRCQSLVQTSDVSLKKNVSSLPAGNLYKISMLNGITYQFLTPSELNMNNKTDGDTSVVMSIKTEVKLPQTEKTHIGFSAQEVKEVFPDLVVADQDGLLGIDYSGLIPVLVEAIKEQQVQVEALKKEIIQLRELIKQ